MDWCQPLCWYSYVYNKHDPQLTNLQLELSECVIIDPIQLLHHLKGKVSHHANVVHSPSSCRLG